MILLWTFIPKNRRKILPISKPLIGSLGDNFFRRITYAVKRIVTPVKKEFHFQGPYFSKLIVGFFKQFSGTFLNSFLDRTSTASGGAGVVRPDHGSFGYHPASFAPRGRSAGTTQTGWERR